MTLAALRRPEGSTAWPGGPRIGVIGAGPGGLAAALLLTAAGLRVTLFERLRLLGLGGPEGRRMSAKTVAVVGGEALYVLVHTPWLRPNHDWTAMFPAHRRTILEKLKRTAGLHDIEERIVWERHLTPQDIHERYRVLDGAIYGLASHGLFTGAFKPGNRSRNVKGLYLAGGSAHPGPGMPMVMMSGWIAPDAADADLRTAAGGRRTVGPGSVARAS